MRLCVSIFIFRLEPTVREQLNENEKLLDQAMFKVLSQQLQDTLTMVFETIHYS